MYFKSGPQKEIKMTDLVAVLVQLKKERAQLDKAITALSGAVRNNSGAPSRKGGSRLSVAARKRIGAAQRARWAAWKAKQNKVA